MPGYVDLEGRRSAAEVTLQPGDPIWHRQRASVRELWVVIRGTFKSYGQVRCVVELDRKNAPRIATVDPANVFPRLDDDERERSSER